MHISSECLTLRHFNESDLAALHRIWSDPATIWWGAITSIEESRRLLSRAVERGWYHFVSSEWGKGYATEACRAVLATINGRCVQAAIVPENHRSRRVATRLGMTIVGQVIEAELLHDLWEVRL